MVSWQYVSLSPEISYCSAHVLILDQPVTKKTIVDIVAGFGVQADNLWWVAAPQRRLKTDPNSSFLAQDKVADFAKMAPVKVLEETIKAAGDPRLSKWHETLIEKGNKAREIEAVSAYGVAVCFRRLISDFDRSYCNAGYSTK